MNNKNSKNKLVHISDEEINDIDKINQKIFEESSDNIKNVINMIADCIYNTNKGVKEEIK